MKHANKDLKIKETEVGYSNIEVNTATTFHNTNAQQLNQSKPTPSSSSLHTAIRVFHINKYKHIGD